MKQISSGTWKEAVDDAFIVRRRRDGKIRDELSRRIASLKSNISCCDFPTNVEAIASHVGVREIRRVPLANRGLLIRIPGGFAVELNQELDSRDQRFVLAHEITHLLIAGGSFPKRNGTRWGYSRIEALCDFGAREILLPMRTVRHELKQSANFSLADLAIIAKEADCSMRVAAKVVSDLPGEWQDFVFFFCKKGFAALDIEDIVPSIARKVELSSDEMSTTRRALVERRLVRGPETIWVDACEIKIFVEAMPLNNTTIAILTRSPALRLYRNHP